MNILSFFKLITMKSVLFPKHICNTIQMAISNTSIMSISQTSHCLLLLIKYPVDWTFTTSKKKLGLLHISYINNVLYYFKMDSHIEYFSNSAEWASA